MKGKQTVEIGGGRKKEQEEGDFAGVDVYGYVQWDPDSKLIMEQKH